MKDIYDLSEYERIPQDLVKLTLSVDRKSLKKFRKKYPDVSISRFVSAELHDYTIGK